MKNATKTVFLLGVILFFAQSCHIEKRRYSKGFYIQTRSNSGEGFKHSEADKGDVKSLAALENHVESSNENVSENNVDLSDGVSDTEDVISSEMEIDNVTKCDARIQNNSNQTAPIVTEKRVHSITLRTPQLKNVIRTQASDQPSKKGKAVVALLFLALALVAFGIIFLFVPEAIGLVAGILCLCLAFFALIAALTVAIV